ncbi:NADH-quinone oxidoreductase subunit NuoE [Pseudohoeflea coraliihabitans]|uniref:NADH-quinone oxidoreductase subunit NuoE n=1 Tax=Pseudohoeflea coraliihabitans TaxID=2860393 RepID=UPI002105374D|nr:NADH-quinone oxidoreductase subunit NuoE [Pseudohoeflea sp. DP4N28-3]
MSVRRLADETVQPESFAFNRNFAAEAKVWIKKYPKDRRQSAVIPLLMLAQEQEGWVTRASIEHVADMLAMPYIRALEVATFYTQFQLKPVGTRAHVQVCGTTPCMLRGSEELIELCKTKIHPEPLHPNADGTLSWEEVECQGACVNAPMVMIFKDAYEDLTVERLAEIIDAFEAGRGDEIKPGPQIDRIFSAPVGGPTTLTSDPTRSHPAAEQPGSQGDSPEGSPEATQIGKPDAAPKYGSAETLTSSRPIAPSRKRALNKTAESPAADPDGGSTSKSARKVGVKSADKASAQGRTGASAPDKGEAASAPDKGEAASTKGRKKPKGAATGENAGASAEKKAGAPVDTGETAWTERAAAKKSRRAAEAAQAENSPAAAETRPAKGKRQAAAEDSAPATGGSAKPALDDAARPAGMDRPAEPDDLKLISGVGPKIEQTLNSLGIYTFAQIAAWDQAEREWVDGYLRFRGRIERDDWIRQATALAKGGRDEYVRVFGKEPR